MGLDTLHDCWHGAYSSFSKWRNMLAELAGYELGDLGRPAPTVMIDWGHVSSTNLQGEWDYVPCRIDGTPDPLLILLIHADDRGVISTRFCEPLARRLEELTLLHMPADFGDRMKSRTMQFMNGLRRAALAGEDVEFH